MTPCIELFRKADLAAVKEKFVAAMPPPGTPGDEFVKHFQERDRELSDVGLGHSCTVSTERVDWMIRIRFDLTREGDEESGIKACGVVLTLSEWRALRAFVDAEFEEWDREGARPTAAD